MFNAGFDSEAIREVPSEAQEQAAKISLDIEQEELREAQSLSKKITSLNADYQKELRLIIGDRNLERYYEFRAPLREKINDLEVKATPTVKGQAEIEEAQSQAVGKSQQFLNEIGFDMVRASKLREGYNARLDEVVSQARGKLEEPNYLILPEVMSMEELKATPWVILDPAYPADSFAYSSNRSDEPDNPVFWRYLNRSSGQLGSYTRNRVSGADDSDYAYVRYQTAMRFWYRIPDTGLTEVFMRLQAIDTAYSGSFNDEWGWSDARCEQMCSAYLRVITPGPGAIRYGTILNYVRTGTSANWANQITAPGNERWANLFSTSSYNAGTWLLLEVGTEDWNYFRSNDVSIVSTMNMNWFLKQIYVRSTAA
ncbi:hypothetical protein [Rivularia sp. UHCC 0363]|uniref:hypothetical protein n=1 Tax=Rivularia sp. UHCC 0363 TaxID=3110244 RepID=UPI002B212089|nr:hypothetical protein [Rivularia sp. UHCC 0363]MEA5597797.1 hypothetical protein [Rivularia sp. UHCC 0363]